MNQDNIELNDRMAMTGPQRGPASTSRDLSARGSFRPMTGALNNNFGMD